MYNGALSYKIGDRQAIWGKEQTTNGQEDSSNIDKKIFEGHKKDRSIIKGMSLALNRYK